ncbi:unnamed protein product [Ectocarpus sp. 8 AP-2014]
MYTNTLLFVAAPPLLLLLTSTQHVQHPSFLLLTGDGDVGGRLELLWGVAAMHCSGCSGCAALGCIMVSGAQNGPEMRTPTLHPTI